MNLKWVLNTAWQLYCVSLIHGFPRVSVAKNPANTGNVGSIPGLGRSPEEGNGNRLQ